MIILLCVLYLFAKTGWDPMVMWYIFLGTFICIFLVTFLYIGRRGMYITKLFVQYRYAIYTKNALILNTHIYNSHKEIPIVSKLAKIFHEVLGHASTLDQAEEQQSDAFYQQLLSPFESDPMTWIYAIPLYIVSLLIYVL